MTRRVSRHVVRAPASPALPPLPASVFSAYGPIPVELVKDLCDPATGESIFGYWDPMLRVIRVRAGMHATVSWLTLFHEETHADLAEVGVKLTYNQIEAICNAVAAARYARMLATLHS